MNKKLFLLALFSVVFIQELSEKYKNEKYDYKNYVVTFENLNTEHDKSTAIWKVEGDTISTKGNWFSHLVKLKSEGWEVSRAMPGEWKGIEKVTMIYYLEKLKSEEK